MADDSQLQIVVGAKIDGLVQGTKQAQSAVRAFTDDVKSQSSSLGNALTTGLSPLSSFRPNISAFSGASSALKDVGVAATTAGHGTAGFYRELLVLGHELSMGNYKRFGGSLMVLAERSGKLTEIFGAVLAVATPMNLAIAGTVAVLGAVGLEAEKAAESMAKVRQSFASVGNDHLFDPARVQAMTTALEHMAGGGAKEAAQVINELGRAADLTDDELEKIRGSLPDLVAKFGSAEAAGKGLAEAVDDPSAALRRLHDEMARNNPDLLNAASNFLEMGDKASASRTIIDYLTTSAQGLHEKGLTPLGKAWEFVRSHMAEVLSLSAPLLGEIIQVGKAAAGAASYVFNLAEALGKMRPGVVGLKQALRSQSLEMEGQTYNMDASPEGRKALDQIKAKNALLAQRDDIARKLNAHQKENNLLELQAGLADAKARGDTGRIASYSAAIAAEEKKINASRLTEARKAQAAQLLVWETTLTDELETQKIFGAKAKAFEIRYWEEKKLQVAKGSAEYRTISDKIYQLQSQAYDKDVTAFKAAEAKKLEAAKKALEDDRRAAIAHLDEKAALYKGDFNKFVKAEQDKLKFLQGAYGRESAQAQQQQARMDSIVTQHLQQQRQSYTQFFGSITSGFNSALMGMIQGTQTFGQAVGNVFLSMGEAVLGVLEDIAAKWVVTQIVGDTAASISARGQIAGDAAVAGAAAFASTAAIPIVGPELAPAAGAAAYGATMAYQAAVPGFAVGAWEIPGDMMANIHQGEMILPKPFADSVRENGGFSGKGGDTHIHISAIDAQSVQRLFRSNGGALIDSIHHQARNGHPKARGLGI